MGCSIREWMDSTFLIVTGKTQNLPLIKAQKEKSLLDQLDARVDFKSFWIIILQEDITLS